MEEYIFRVYCTVEGDYFYTDWLTDPPSVCPNNSGHSIDASATIVEDTKHSDKDGYIFTGFQIDLASGQLQALTYAYQVEPIEDDFTINSKGELEVNV